jgi:hypothetical protein
LSWHHEHSCPFIRTPTNACCRPMCCHVLNSLLPQHRYEWPLVSLANLLRESIIFRLNKV